MDTRYSKGRCGVSTLKIVEMFFYYPILGSFCKDG